MIKGLYDLIKTWWPSALTLSVVLYVTLAPHPVGADKVLMFPGADKVVHAVMMGGLVGALVFDRRRSGKVPGRRFVVWTAFGVVVFSVVDEWLQAVMGMGRTFDVGDIAADVVGVMIAALLAPPVVAWLFEKTS